MCANATNFLNLCPCAMFLFCRCCNPRALPDACSSFSLSAEKGFRCFGTCCQLHGTARSHHCLLCLLHGKGKQYHPGTQSIPSSKKDAQPLPKRDDTLSTAQWFSMLDLASGYWQVEVEPADREKTTFATAHGLYQFCVMPFGLCNAPGTFQQLMEHVLVGLHWTSCLVYLDDIIIFSQIISDHLQKL